MKSTKFVLSVLSILTLAVLMATTVNAQTVIFTDTFEDGTLDKWTTGQTDYEWKASQTQPAGGLWHAIYEGSVNATEAASMSVSFSTAGYENINLEFDRMLKGIDATDNFKVLIDYGNGEITLFDTGSDAYDETEYTQMLFELTGGSDDPQITLRFECDADNEAESCNIDNVKITGDEISQEIEFCTAGSVPGGLVITDIDIDAPGDDEEWNLLDEVTIKVDVENEGTVDYEDIIVEMGLFDGEGINRIGQLEFYDADEEEQEVGDLDEGDDETATFEFKVPADTDDGNYRLIFKAYPSGDENENCVEEENTQKIDVQRESEREKSIVVDDINFPFEAICGDIVSGDFTVYNIGRWDEDQVKVEIFNTELGLFEEIVIREDLDEGDDDTLQFSFEIPEGIEEKLYRIQFKTYYDYDDNDDQYDEESEDIFTHQLTVFGCSASGGGNGNGEDGNALITASTNSNPRAGDELEVSVTVKNTGDETATFIVDALNFQSWADFGSITPSNIVTLDAGEVKSMTITLNIQEDAEGTESFTIQTLSGNNVNTRVVEVNIQAGSSGGFTGFSIGELGESGFVWVLVLINVILIILIIVVAVRLTRH